MAHAPYPKEKVVGVPPDKDDAWLLSWHREEVRSLSSRVQELEARRRRTRVLVSALVVGLFVALVAAGHLWLQLHDARTAALQEPPAPAAAVVPDRADPVATAAVADTGPPAGPGPGPLAALPEVAPPPATEDDGLPRAALPVDGIDLPDDPPGGPSEVDTVDQAATAELVDGTSSPPGEADEPALGDEPPQEPGAGDAAGLPRVATAWVNLRDGPSLDAEVLSVVPEGAVVRELGEENGWSHVEVEGDAGTLVGYVYGTYLRPADPASLE